MKIVIIGGVAAGMSAASKINRSLKDAEIIVFERTQEVSYGACGLPYYISNVNDNEDLLRIRKSSEFIKSGIDLRINTEVINVDFSNKNVTAVNKMSNETYVVGYDKLIIATGASPIMPNLEGKDYKNVFTLKSIDDANKIKEAAEGLKNVVIVGAGYIGLELVETFKVLNMNVRVIEMADRILPTFDAEITDVIHDYLTKEKINIHVSEQVTKIIGKEGIVEKVVTNKSEYDADMVVVCVGVRPNTKFLGNELQMLPNGAIVVGKNMETNIENVYSGGDCASVYHKVLNKNVFIPLGTNANKQGKLIGEVICGKKINFKGVLGTALAKIMDLEIGVTGVTENQAIKENIEYAKTFITAPNHAPYYPNPTNISIKLIYDKNTRKVLGAQIVGSQGAALRTDVLATCIYNEMTVEDMQYMDLGYAPPFAHVWDAIHVAANSAK